jgi:DNA-binding NtrC family response regulator
MGITKRDSSPAHSVLVVDDEADIRELLELTLMRMGLNVTTAGSVKQALEQLQKQKFDLCLTDMRLPDGEGLQVVEHIHQHNLDIPIAVITAYGSTENAVRALKLGAFDYLAKPIALEQLRTLVKSALALEPATTQGKARRQQRVQPFSWQLAQPGISAGDDRQTGAQQCARLCLRGIRLRQGTCGTHDPR